MYYKLYLLRLSYDINLLVWSVIIEGNRNKVFNVIITFNEICKENIYLKEHSNDLQMKKFPYVRSLNINLNTIKSFNTNFPGK